jgi:hypothetical protein
MSSSEGGQVTGTQDKDYNLIWFAEQCLSNALRLETYVQDADRDGDSELAGFFRRAQAESKKGADQGQVDVGQEAVRLRSRRRQREEPAAEVRKP